MNDITSKTSPRRRIFNIIWTAAEDYGFEPAFTAFFQDGEPDFYMNSIIGYARKWYKSEATDRLFEALRKSVFHETLDGLLWIAMENCAYEKEVRSRPLLKELRLKHAEEFFEREERLSKQQWMAMNSVVYALQAAKCREVLGRDTGLVSPKEKRLYRELQYGGDMTPEEIEARTLDIFRRYYRFSPSDGREGLGLLQKLKKVLSRPLPIKIIRNESLSFGKPPDESKTALRAVSRAFSAGKSRTQPKESDRLYIEGCFGKSIFSDEENERINNSLCTDEHQLCKLHFTDGAPDRLSPRDSLIRKAIEEASLQREKNKSFYRRRRLIYQRNIIRLSEQIKNAMLIHSQPLPVLSKSGIFNPEHVWRAVKVSDPRVFMDVISEEQADFSVDLLLDASASRLESQELIAAQAYIIASSLKRCGIPIQVCSFLSIRGFTVLRRFCGYDACLGKNGHGSLERIFDYCSAGWNRDGLAFRGVSRLMKDSESKNHILIVLTDASPNDDRKIPPQPTLGRFVSADYSGKAGIENTAAEVRRLRDENVRVMAILNGRDDDTRAARRIYGNDFIRIENLSCLSSAAGSLIRSQIEKVRNR